MLVARGLLFAIFITISGSWFFEGQAKSLSKGLTKSSTKSPSPSRPSRKLISGQSLHNRPFTNYNALKAAPKENSAKNAVIKVKGTASEASDKQTTLDSSDADTDLVLSFKDWREQKVRDAVIKLGALKQEIESVQSVSKSRSADPNFAKASLEGQSQDLNQMIRLERQLKAQEMTVEILRDLTVVDYLVGYLSKFENQKAVLNSFVLSLSPEEAVEVVKAYLNAIKRPETTAAAMNENQSGRN